MAPDTWPDGDGMASLVVTHVSITLLIIVEFILLQAVAVGVTTVVYSLIPALDAGARPSFDDWRRIFQVVGPTVTVSGGAGIVLSSIIFHWQAQKERQRAEAIRLEAQAEVQTAREEARAEVQAARAEAQAAQAEAQAAQAEVQAARTTADERLGMIVAMRAELDRLNERLERLESNGSQAST